MWKSVGRAPSLRVLAWHLPYNREKSTENLSQGKKNLSQVKINLKVQYTYYQKHTHYKTHTRIHTLQNNIKPPQYKLEQNAYRQSNST
jgi:hypothetical protein